MTKEASELVNEFKFMFSTGTDEMPLSFAKKCALKCVEKMKISHENWSTEQWEVYDELNELKKEIEKL